jgi:hypothetical protein
MTDDIVERLRVWEDARSREAAAEIERLRARVEVLEAALADARDNGLVYWDPVTTRGGRKRAGMIARIDTLLTKEAKP